MPTLTPIKPLKVEPVQEPDPDWFEEEGEPDDAA